MKLFIKNMVCIRCKMVVIQELKNLGLSYTSIILGEADIVEAITPDQTNLLRIGLLKSGLDLMDDRKSVLIERIKNIIVEMIHYAEETPKLNFSQFLSEKLHYDYTYLANLFSSTMGITIEHFIIAHKIERVKELLVYENLTLTEIAYKMDYSSVAHLANQFRKVTGFTASHYKKLNRKDLISLNSFNV